MPHVIYLHSPLTQDRMPCRDDRERSRVPRFERTEMITALGLAGLVNMAMLAVAAKLSARSSTHGTSTRTRSPGPRTPTRSWPASNARRLKQTLLQTTRARHINLQIFR